MIEDLYKDYDKYSDFYDIFNKYRNYNRETRFILNFTKNKKYLLDLGCGTGTHLNILENLGYKVIGLDKSKNMVLFCVFQLTKFLSISLSLYCGLAVCSGFRFSLSLLSTTSK